MEESRTQKLQQVLKRLGQAVHGSVVKSKEVRACLDELHREGWRAVMMLEASLVCRDGGGLEVEEGAIHIHVDPSEISANYRLDSDDARLLSSLGISPSRHRVPRTTARRQSDDEPGRPDR